jgi:hypothetical protein
LFLAEAYYHAGATKQGSDLTRKLVRNMNDDIRYIASLPESGREAMSNDAKRDVGMIYQLFAAALQAGDNATADQLLGTLEKLGNETREMAEINSMVNQVLTELKRMRTAPAQQLQIPRA